MGYRSDVAIGGGAQGSIGIAGIFSCLWEALVAFRVTGYCVIAVKMVVGASISFGTCATLLTWGSTKASCLNVNYL